MKKCFVVFISFIALNITAQGYKHFTIEQGLPSNRVYKILQDYDGFIWIATDKGLSKFDGDSFKNFTIASGLPSNDIWQIILTRDNKLWFFTRSNKIGYIRNDSIYSFPAQKGEFLYPTQINTDLKQIYFKSYNHNYTLKHQKWQIIPIHKKDSVHFASLKVIHSKISYLSMQSNNDIDSPRQFILTDSLLHPLSKLKTSYNDLYVKGQINDSLIAISSEKGIHFINLNNLKFYHIIKPAFFKKNLYIRTMATDKDVQISTENFWANLGNDYQLKNIKTFPKKFNLTTVFKDRKGNFWGTTYAKGVYFFPKNALSSQNELPNEPVQFLKIFNKQLFAGVLNKGIYRFNPATEKFERFFKNKDYLFDFYYEDDQNFAVISNTSTFIKNHNRLIEYKRIGKGLIKLENGLYAIRERGQITVFNRNLKLIKTYPLEGCNDFISYNNHLFCGTPIGLFQIVNDSIKRINFFQKPIPVLSLNKIGNYLIVGTDGLGVYVRNAQQKILFLKETKGLIVNHIFVNGNMIWLATQKGVYNYFFEKGQFYLKKILRRTDGLISDHVNHVVVFNDKLYTSNFSGISSVNLNPEQKLSLQKIYFKSINYNGKNIHDKDKIAYRQNNNLLINFGLIDFTGQEHNRYFYQLLPVQNNWLEIDSKNINFNNLKPNDYTFNVKVVNPYRQAFTKSFSFSITPLWWQTGWAHVLMVITILFTFFTLAYWMRRKELRKQRAKLVAQKQMAEFELHALRSQMNPHFVFNSLNAIQYYINDENYDKSESYLVKFSRLIRMIFEFSRKKSIKLKQEIDLLKSYLNLEKMRFGDRFNYCINIDKKLNIDTREIPTLLLQPIVENAVNHGIFHKKGKGTICLDFKYLDENSYEIQIKDDGVGLEKSAEINKRSLKKHQSRSTQILKDRIKLLNLSGKWQITYEITDKTKDQQTTYNTIVKLKITKL